MSFPPCLCGSHKKHEHRVLVRFAQSLTASQTEFLGDRGEVTLSAGRLEVPTNRFRAGTPDADHPPLRCQAAAKKPSVPCRCGHRRR